MRPGELAQRAEVTGPPAGEDDEVRSLREDVLQLARALPGDLRRLTVRNGDSSIEIEWATEDRPPADGAGVPGPRGLTLAADPASDAEVPADLTAVHAPLVGTFYAAPAPEAGPFVRVGDEVEAGQTLGIVEAMKLMNPIVADEAGVVAEVVVGDAESVEYGQVLMYLRCDGGPR
ncbi:biotin/lipoyl-containing protein [Modestobacter sp. KNN46-3]|uniref:acetyl-CoA carboxylase biotin carboxyl carrier protein n=1 Tax=Modestobacter sp. KNN46-3 TaxID=2711218 RepID=UPI001F14FE1B|nr:biotin/lipoyl-containing protein [Modestobacter sp. KNN46-3]